MDCRHTFEVAPVFILVEHFVIARLVELFGWPEGDGIFSPGKKMCIFLVYEYRRVELSFHIHA